jgi:asparagine synthase (glutamine-hydrolysing)
MADLPTDPGSKFAVALTRALARWNESAEPFTLLLSGGLDSSLLAWELRHARGLSTVTVGRAGARDLDAGATAARLLGVAWGPTVVSDATIGQLSARLERWLAPLPPVLRSVQLALAIAVDAATTRSVLCGQGADELFLGYAHFRGLDRPGATVRAEADLERLLRSDWPLARSIARELGHELVAPYLDESVVSAAQEVDIAERLPGDEPKRWLREWAIRRGLPEPLALRPKRALQFGTGVDAWRRQHERELPPS